MKAAWNLYLPWRVYHPAHGPQVWPWWRLVVMALVRASVHAPSTGWHLWIYTRWGAVMGAFYIDRRGYHRRRLIVGWD